jgi:hypothetical protein
MLSNSCHTAPGLAPEIDDDDTTCRVCDGPAEARLLMFAALSFVVVMIAVFRECLVALTGE